MISKYNNLAVLAIAFCATVINANDSAPVIVDLSKDFQIASTFNNNPGADSIQELASQNELIRSVVVLQDGQVVADYTRDGVDPSRPYPIWSATKSWTSLLMGMLVQEGLLRLDETLGEIFDDPSDWDLVEEVTDDLSFRQAVTVEEMLTMTSGLHLPSFFAAGAAASSAIDDEMSTFSIQDASFGWYDGGTMGGVNVSDALADPEVAASQTKTFRYLAANNILSYVTQKRTGMTPGQYLEANVLPALGIDMATMNWWQNQDGVEYAYHGMSLTSLQMAKWGQLYLQQGKSNVNTQLLDPSWVQASTSLQANNLMYGYLIWVYHGDVLQQPQLGPFFCAQGMGGQDICVSPLTGRVVVQQRDLPILNTATAPEGTSNLDVSMLALDPELTFTTSN